MSKNPLRRLGVDEQEIKMMMEKMIEPYGLCPDGKRLFMLYLFADDDKPGASDRAWRAWIEHKNNCAQCLGLKPRHQRLDNDTAYT